MLTATTKAPVYIDTINTIRTVHKYGATNQRAATATT